MRIWFFFFFSSRRRHTRSKRDWSSDVCSSDLLTLVATDGRRLAMAEIELEFPRSHESDLIAPTKAVTELQRLLTEDGHVKVSMSNGQIAFDLKDRKSVV